MSICIYTNIIIIIVLTNSMKCVSDESMVLGKCNIIDPINPF